MQYYTHLKTSNLYALITTAIAQPSGVEAAVYALAGELNLPPQFWAKNTEFNPESPESNPELFSSIEFFRIERQKRRAIALPPELSGEAI